MQAHLLSADNLDDLDLVFMETVLTPDYLGYNLKFVKKVKTKLCIGNILLILLQELILIPPSPYAADVAATCV
jgi:hypothetical protein